jgi:hypothetical protein
MQEVLRVFDAAMQETQTELSDAENELIRVLLDATLEKDATLSAGKVASLMRVKPFEDTSERGFVTWIGRTLKQMSLFSKKLRITNGKRVYIFEHEHIKKMRDRHISNSLTQQATEVSVHEVPSSPTTLLTMEDLGLPEDFDLSSLETADEPVEVTKQEEF